MTVAASTARAIRARRTGFHTDVFAVSVRALKSIQRDPESVLPGLIVPVFFFAAIVGAMKDLAETVPGVDYKEFQVPVAIIFAVTGISRAVTLVIDIQSGYFDRLSISPVNRLALLLGHMVADFALVVALTIPVIIMGLIIGVGFGTGFGGALVFIVLSGLWGLVFTGFPYAIALKTGNPAAVNTTWLLFMPFSFLTTTFLPREAMTGWMAAIAQYNPVTYLLDALRSLLSDGWDGMTLLLGFGAVAGVGVVSMSLAMLALRSRVRQSK